MIPQAQVRLLEAQLLAAQSQAGGGITSNPTLLAAAMHAEPEVLAAQAALQAQVRPCMGVCMWSAGRVHASSLAGGNVKHVGRLRARTEKGELAGQLGTPTLWGWVFHLACM